MELGIAIPTYSGHLYNLKKLLEQISKSTVLPKQVSVSISSFYDEILFDDYPYELIITKNKNFQNVSQNCNTAASKLNTDIISFFGGDDLPHIKRNEYIIKSFNMGADAVVHNYLNSNKNVSEFCEDIGNLQVFLDYIDTYVSEHHYPISSIDSSFLCYANGAISVTKKIFEKFKYNEDMAHFKCEDSLYNGNLIKNGYKISYIKNKLMLYIH